MTHHANPASAHSAGPVQSALVRPADSRLARVWSEHEAGFEQDDDDRAALIVVGPLAPDSMLPRLARRFGYTVQQLQEFRRAQS